MQTDEQIVVPGAVAPSPVSAFSSTAAQGLRICAATTLAELEPHAVAWNRLSTLSHDRIARHSHPFVRTYLAQCVTLPDRWLCLFAYVGNRLVGVAPVIIPAEENQPGDRSALGRNARLRVLTLLAAEGYENKTAVGFLAELERRLPHFFSIALNSLHENAAVFRVDRKMLGSIVVFREESTRGSYIRIAGSFADYSAALSGSLRRHLRKWKKRLSETNTHFHVLSGQEITDEDFDQFLAVEASGWKGQTGTAISSQPNQVKFYRELLHSFRKVGWLELYFLTANGRTIAGLLAIRVGSTLNLWKMGYDEAYAHCGPGHLLMEKIIERAYALGTITDVNCLSDAAWIQRWRAIENTYTNLYLYPLRPTSVLRGAVPMAARRTVAKLPGAPQFIRTIRAWRATIQRVHVARLQTIHD